MTEAMHEAKNDSEDGEVEDVVGRGEDMQEGIDDFK